MILLLFNTFILKLKIAKYLAKIGFIVYAIIEIYIDITFAIFIINRFAQNLSSKYFYIINQILHFLAKS